MNTNKIVLTKEENVFLPETYFSTKFYKTCMEQFAQKSDGWQLNKTFILWLIRWFREHDVITKVPYMPSVRTILTLAKVVKVGEKF